MPPREMRAEHKCPGTAGGSEGTTWAAQLHEDHGDPSETHRRPIGDPSTNYTERGPPEWDEHGIRTSKGDGERKG